MKRKITLTVMLISLLAVGAYAQAESEPVKDQARQDGSENAVNPDTGTANQNYTDYENEKPGEAHDPSGPAGEDAKGDAIQGDLGDKSLDGDKVDGELVKEQTRQDGSENAQNPGTGTANQNYTDYENAKPGEAHDPSGPAGENAQGDAIQGDKVLDGDKVGECDGDQTQQRLHGDGDGNNHELGENNRNGDEFTGEGGPHGPMGTGPDGDLLKIFGDEADGSFAGQLMRHSWGPGTSDLEGPFGPNSGVAGFGPGGRDAVDGKGDPATGARGQARSGRR